MTLDNLLEEIKYGKEYVETKTALSQLKESIDEKTNTISFSKRAKNLLKQFNADSQYTKKLDRAIRSLKEYEEKVAEGKLITPIYAKMKVDTIVEDVNSAIASAEKERVTNPESFGRIIANLRFAVKNITESKNVSTKKFFKSTSLIEAYAKKEGDVLEEFVL